jgi:hypothetical protein
LTKRQPLDVLKLKALIENKKNCHLALGLRGVGQFKVPFEVLGPYLGQVE